MWIPWMTPLTLAADVVGRVIELGDMVAQRARRGRQEAGENETMIGVSEWAATVRSEAAHVAELALKRAERSAGNVVRASIVAVQATKLVLEEGLGVVVVLGTFIVVGDPKDWDC